MATSTTVVNTLVVLVAIGRVEVVIVLVIVVVMIVIDAVVVAIFGTVCTVGIDVLVELCAVIIDEFTAIVELCAVVIVIFGTV